MAALLLGLELAGRDVLVVGGGRVGARRARMLADAGARVRVVAPTVVDELADLVEDGRLRHDPRPVTPDDLTGVWLVHTATGVPGVDRAVAAWAEDRRVWCIDATDGAGTRVRVPARGRVDTEDGPAEVAVLTGSPRRSTALRDRLLGVVA